MTPEQKEAARRAEIMLAFSRGEAIERCISKVGDWERTIIPNWNWVDFDYRVARVPIELRVALAYDPTGGLINSRVVGFLNADEVHRRLVPGGPELVLIVREVIE